MSESRIVTDHRIMGGVPCVRGTRIPVATIVGLVAKAENVVRVGSIQDLVEADL